jgi:hypothetical protein
MTLVRTAGPSYEILTRDLPNKKQERYPLDYEVGSLHLLNLVTIEKPEVSTPLIQNSAIGHDPKPVLSPPILTTKDRSKCYLLLGL